MTITPRYLTSYQRCPRRFRLEQEYQPLRWQPKQLFDSVLRRSLLSLSTGVDKETVTKQAQSLLLGVAANPGLDTLYEPYGLARDLCAALSTILEATSHLTLLSLHQGGQWPLGDHLGDHLWQSQAFADESGALHRWITLDRLDADALSRELHGWPVFGEMAVTGMPLTLHTIEIGRFRKGHLNGDWTRAYTHPVIAGRFKFQRVDGRKLGPGWKPTYFVNANTSPKEWVDQQILDNVQHIHHLNVKDLSLEQQKEGRRQILSLANSLRNLPTYSELPMFRPACDSPFMCPFQPVCYQSGEVKSVEEVGGFVTLPSLRDSATSQT